MIARILLPPEERRARVFYWLLVAVIGGLAIYLWNAEPPWDAKLRRMIERRESIGLPWRIEQYIAVFSWFAAAFNLALAVILFTTLRFWTRPLESKVTVPARGRFPRWFMIGLGVALLLGAFYRVQLLNHSLWSDEEYTVRSHIWGKMVELDDGSLQHQAVPWRDTFFRNKGNNHLGFTIPTRVLHDGWASIWATTDRPFSEAVLRLLPLLASFGSIALIGLMVARYTNPLTGLGAAFLLALSAWHVRHSVAARGYSQMFFFLLLSFQFLIPAIRYGRWRDWLGVAGAQLGTMLCAPLAIDVLLISNGAALAMVLFKGDRIRRDRVTLASRMVVANLLAAMVFWQLIAPSEEQIRAYLSSGPLVGQMSLDWWRGIWITLTSGLPPNDLYPSSHIGTSFPAEAATIPGMRLFFLVALPCLVVLGIIAAIRQRSWLLLPALATIGGGFLAFIQNRITGNLMHPWYVLYMLIGFVIFVVLGVEFVAKLIGFALDKKGRPRSARTMAATVAVLMAILLTTYGLMTANTRNLDCQHSRHPIREVVATVRGDLAYAAQDGDLVTASFSSCKGMIASYDPRNHVLRKPADLRKIIDEARSSGKRLVIYACSLEHAHVAEQEILEVVENPALFIERSPPVFGLGEMGTYHTYELIGASSESESE